MKQKTTLIIDTRSAVKTTVSLIYERKETKKTIQTNHAHSQAVLPLIEELLKKAQCALKDIESIEVRVDKGSYTGRRVGAAIAQTLGMILSVPVNKSRYPSPIDIVYESDKWDVQSMNSS